MIHYRSVYSLTHCVRIHPLYARNISLCYYFCTLRLNYNAGTGSIGTDKTCNVMRSYVTLCLSVTHSGSAGGQGNVLLSEFWACMYLVRSFTLLTTTPLFIQFH